MANKRTNYVQEKRDRKSKIFLIAILSVTALFIIGLVAAYYSDTFYQSGDLTSNTLDIEGNYTFTLNGEATSVDSIRSLDPGDVIVIKGNVTNVGSQSAWIRELVTFDAADAILLENIKVFYAEYTQAELLAQPGLTENLIPITDGAAASASRVINGVSDNPQEVGGGFEYIGSDSYTFSITVYFMHTAPNATQGATFGITVATQALQFRNNNTAVPTEDAWLTVVGL